MAQSPQTTTKKPKTTSVSQSLSKVRKEEGPQIDRAELMHFLKFYALPIFSALLFLGVVFFTVIPNIQYVFDQIEEIDQLRNEDEQLEQRIDRLVALRQSNAERQQLISQINALVPTGKSEVVNFRERVVATTNSQNLNLNDTKSGETILDAESATVTSIEGFSIIQIPSEFSMDGEFANFRNFLIRLYDGTDFFIVDQMSLDSNQSEEENASAWTGEFNLTKYQFYADDDFNATLVFASVPETAQPDQVVIEFLQERFLNNDQEVDTITPVTPTVTPTP